MTRFRILFLFALFSVAIALAVQPLIVKPRTYDPGATGIITSAWVPNTGFPSEADHFGLVLQKQGPTSAEAAAVAELTGVEGLSTDNFRLEFDYRTNGHCGAGAPRFNVYLNGDETTYFVGCTYGTHTTTDPDWAHALLQNADSFPPIPPGKTVRAIYIVFDEGTDTAVGGRIATAGTVTIDNIAVNGGTPVGKPGSK